MRGHFEGTRNRVINGCSRGGGRRLCKEDVGWIVDLKNFLAMQQTVKCTTIHLSCTYSKYFHSYKTSVFLFSLWFLGLKMLSRSTVTTQIFFASNPYFCKVFLQRQCARHHLAWQTAIPLQTFYPRTVFVHWQFLPPAQNIFFQNRTCVSASEIFLQMWNINWCLVTYLFIRHNRNIKILCVQINTLTTRKHQKIYKSTHFPEQQNYSNSFN